MPSEQVTSRQKTARAVAAAAETHADDVARALEPKLTGALQGREKVPDVALLCRLSARAMVTRCDAMVAADEVHHAELLDDGPAREARDAEVQALRQRSIDLREMLTGVYGAAAASRVFKG